MLKYWVYESDLSALEVKVSGEPRSKFRVALWQLALEAEDSGVAEKILDAGCVTGGRVNRLVEGLTGN